MNFLSMTSCGQGGPTFMGRLSGPLISTVLLATLTGPAAAMETSEPGADVFPEGAEEKANPATDPAVTEHRRTKDGWPRRDLDASEVSRLVGKLVVPAALAEAAYRRDFNGTPDPAHARLKHGCDYVEDAAKDPKGLPDRWVRVDQARLVSWGVKLDKKSLCRAEAGLNYELYAKVTDGGQPSELALAYRGTENDSWQAVHDWLANFSGLKLGGKDYRQARRVAQSVANAFRPVLPKIARTPQCELAKNPKDQIPLLLVGHSLGGGLAQHAAYSLSACDATEAITFDTSPVTGWTSLLANLAIRNADPAITRAYVSKEVLSGVRKITTTFNFARKHRVDYRMTFSQITSDFHSMTQFAKNLSDASRLASSPSTESMAATRHQGR
ncbi:hypothetical protein HNQ51_002744 [Inhella inkyongensis]|uniref:Fungal lipase-like domain-containing protein n=1 Tax=Inhella inkyongensis TaxID=392593 RepID=A0A840S4W4_9BURK|nr:hypothetical protein [Inhella inkyongensis]MBB5205425.1 hypothetical protein [Inhella inkyongensis]